MCKPKKKNQSYKKINVVLNIPDVLLSWSFRGLGSLDVVAAGCGVDDFWWRIESEVSIASYLFVIEILWLEYDMN